MNPAPPCPVCQRAADPRTPEFPFCSDRCRNVDLFRWWSGKHAIIEPLRPEHLDPEQFDLDQRTPSPEDN